jgi:hypothetical protein
MLASSDVVHSFIPMKQVFHTIQNLPKCSINIPVNLSEPKNNRALFLRALADIGGIASITTIFTNVQQDCSSITKRQVARVLQRHPQIISLGAGYYTFVECEIIPVHRWLHHWLSKEGIKTSDECIKAIMQHYPHGDEFRIKLWLQRGNPNIYKTWNGYKARNPSI